MRFVQIINNKKFVLITIFLFLYVILNLLDGERGLVSYYQNLKLKNNLLAEKETIIKKINFFEKRNQLLTNNLDLDFLETLYRKNFMVGKSNEKIYIDN
tara:strand:- start:4 stop:300 length:297 start_codon:yes stop_codon:yes gene_type:complete